MKCSCVYLTCQFLTAIREKFATLLSVSQSLVVFTRYLLVVMLPVPILLKLQGFYRWSHILIKYPLIWWMLWWWTRQVLVQQIPKPLLTVWGYFPGLCQIFYLFWHSNNSVLDSKVLVFFYVLSGRPLPCTPPANFNLTQPTGQRPRGQTGQTGPTGPAPLFEDTNYIYCWRWPQTDIPLRKQS